MSYLISKAQGTLAKRSRKDCKNRSCLLFISVLFFEIRLFFFLAYLWIGLLEFLLINLIIVLVLSLSEKIIPW